MANTPTTTMRLDPELKDRPRKTLGFMKPSEKIIELLDAA